MYIIQNFSVNDFKYSVILLCLFSILFCIQQDSRKKPTREATVGKYCVTKIIKTVVPGEYNKGKPLRIKIDEKIAWKVGLKIKPYIHV